MESGEPLKGLLNEAGASEALRVCMAVQPARATGSECWVHVRAIARVVEASAGIVAAGGCGGVGGGWAVMRLVVRESLGRSPDDQVDADWLGRGLCVAS